MSVQTTKHPEDLYCPICGCGSIYMWPELEEWEKWDDGRKREYEVCPSCDYGSPNFPYEEFE
jgi:protein-disulfide isomerase